MLELDLQEDLQLNTMIISNGIIMIILMYMYIIINIMQSITSTHFKVYLATP